MSTMFGSSTISNYGNSGTLGISSGVGGCEGVIVFGMNMVLLVMLLYRFLLIAEGRKPHSVELTNKCELWAIRDHHMFDFSSGDMVMLRESGVDGDDGSSAGGAKKRY